MEMEKLSKVWQHIEHGGSFGVISPYRKEFSSSENEIRYSELKNQIRTLGYGYIELSSGFKEEDGWVNEKSLFIPNIKKKVLIDLGVKYNQFSVIYKDTNEFIEIGTDENSGIGSIQNNFIQKGWNENLKFDSDLAKDFFSSLAKGSHRDEKFLFNISEIFLNEIISLSFNEVAYGKKRYLKDNTIVKLL